MRRALPPLLLCLLATSAAAEPLRVDGVLVVGRAAPDQPWTDAATEARLADAPELAVVALARDARNRRVVIADADLAPLRLGGRPVRDAERRAWDALALPAPAVRWALVEPHAWREEGVAAPNGASTRWHSNVATDVEHFGRWLGYDQITYFETPLGDFAAGPAARRRAASARPPRPDDDLYGGLGTMRYKVELRLGDLLVASPGAEATDAFGVLPTVHRVSIRRDDSYLGWLSSYFMVPEVFGSAGSGRNNQTERFVGADCADVLTGALRRQGRRDVWYSHVAGLTRYARPVAAPVLLDDAGRPAEPIDGVLPGDLIRIDYAGSLTGFTPRAWDHVVVLWEDKSDPAGPAKGAADGRLDGFDLVVHMGHPHLIVEPLADQAPAIVDVLRWRPAGRGAGRPTPRV